MVPFREEKMSTTYLSFFENAGRLYAMISEAHLFREFYARFRMRSQRLFSCRLPTVTDRCTARRGITDIMLKTALQTAKSMDLRVSQAGNKYPLWSAKPSCKPFMKNYQLFV